MSIPGAPWYSKVLTLFFSQLALLAGQYILYKQGAGPNYTLAGMGLQAAQGAASAFGLSAYGVYAAAVKKVMPSKKEPPQ
jgi:hypothetical protein